MTKWGLRRKAKDKDDYIIQTSPCCSSCGHDIDDDDIEVASDELERWRGDWLHDKGGYTNKHPCRAMIFSEKPESYRTKRGSLFVPEVLPTVCGVNGCGEEL